MAGPYLITGAIPPNGGSSLPYSYCGSLFVVALASRGSISSLPSTIGIFKSADDGATWTQVGGTKTIPSTDDSGLADANFVSTCADLDFPTTPILYTLYMNSTGNLQVSSVDLAIEGWASTGASGPAVNGSEAGSYNLGWLIEVSTEGVFGILAALVPNSSGSENGRVYSLSLSADLNSWSSRTEIPGQSSGFQFDAAAIARGTDGRVHGFINRQDLGDLSDRIYHTLVLGTGGGVGSTFDVVDDGIYIQTPGPQMHAAASNAGDVAVLYVAGVGTDWKLASAIAPSANLPAWNLIDVDSTANGSDLFHGAVAPGSGSGFTVVYSAPGGSFTNQTAFSAGAWASGTALFAQPAIWIALGSTGGTFSTDAGDLWFFSLSGVEIIGGAGMPSTLTFGDTHGVTGGGDPITCGPTLALPPGGGGCGGGSLPGDPSDRECRSGGYSF